MTTVNINLTAGQSVEIGPGITVTVLEFHGGNRVRLRIDAPDGTTVVRSEIVTREPVE